MAEPAPDETPVPEEFGTALRELGLAGEEALAGRPLAGGVSSDIWWIATARGTVCAKRALSKLRVAADWRAPIARNLYEARWMQVAQEASPGCTAQVLGQHPRLGVLVMSYLEPARYELWKQALREGRADPGTARRVGAMLARIHSHSAAHPALAADFPTDAIFFDIRLEPYLLATAEKHPDLAPALGELVVQTQSHQVSLVHGDVSPKNILVGAQGPLLLDAECAWYGDPAFDVAFCLTHLMLKCLWRPAHAIEYLFCFDAFASTYLDAVNWEPGATLEQRTCILLAGMLLARIDGKSPVEYLVDANERSLVRRFAKQFLLEPARRLDAMRSAWVKAIRQ